MSVKIFFFCQWLLHLAFLVAIFFFCLLASSCRLVLSPLCIDSRPILELASGNCESSITKNRGACALTRAGGSLYTIKLKSACREPELSLSGLDPVPLSKIGTHSLASMGSKGKNRNSLACLRNAGSHSAESYCIRDMTHYKRHDSLRHYKSHDSL